MSRNKDRYICGQPRKSKEDKPAAQRSPKDYYRQCVAFHGGDVAYDNWVKGGRKGYQSTGK